MSSDRCLCGMEKAKLPVEPEHKGRPIYAYQCNACSRAALRKIRARQLAKMVIAAMGCGMPHLAGCHYDAFIAVDMRRCDCDQVSQTTQPADDGQSVGDLVKEHLP